MTTVFAPIYRAATRMARTAGIFLPYSVQRPVLALALNEAFRAPLKDGAFDFLNGHSIRVRVDDLGIDWLIGIDPDRFRTLERRQTGDVSISGDSTDFVLLATRQADPDTLFFQRRIRIEGDTELGLGVKNTMDSMDWDDLPPPLRRLLRTLGKFLEQHPSLLAQ